MKNITETTSDINFSKRGEGYVDLNLYKITYDSHIPTGILFEPDEILLLRNLSEHAGAVFALEVTKLAPKLGLEIDVKKINLSLEGDNVIKVFEDKDSQEEFKNDIDRLKNLYTTFNDVRGVEYTITRCLQADELRLISENGVFKEIRGVNDDMYASALYLRRENIELAVTEALKEFPNIGRYEGRPTVLSDAQVKHLKNKGWFDPEVVVKKLQEAFSKNHYPEHEIQSDEIHEISGSGNIDIQKLKEEKAKFKPSRNIDAPDLRIFNSVFSEYMLSSVVTEVNTIISKAKKNSSISSCFSTIPKNADSKNVLSILGNLDRIVSDNQVMDFSNFREISTELSILSKKMTAGADFREVSSILAYVSHPDTGIRPITDDSNKVVGFNLTNDSIALNKNYPASFFSVEHVNAVMNKAFSSFPNLSKSESLLPTNVKPLFQHLKSKDVLDYQNAKDMINRSIKPDEIEVVQAPVVVSVPKELSPAEELTKFISGRAEYSGHLNALDDQHKPVINLKLNELGYPNLEQLSKFFGENENAPYEDFVNKVADSFDKKLAEAARALPKGFKYNDFCEWKENPGVTIRQSKNKSREESEVETYLKKNLKDHKDQDVDKEIRSILKYGNILEKYNNVMNSLDDLSSLHETVLVKFDESGKVNVVTFEAKKHDASDDLINKEDYAVYERQIGNTFSDLVNNINSVFGNSREFSSELGSLRKILSPEPRLSSLAVSRAKNDINQVSA